MNKSFVCLGVILNPDVTGFLLQYMFGCIWFKTKIMILAASEDRFPISQ